MPQLDAGNLLVYAATIKSKTAITVYKFPGFRTVGTLTGFSSPKGLCTDTAGDVWIADTGNARLVEYAHGGTQPIATLTDPYGDPISCSVSAKTGTLAVINSSSNDVLFYENATEAPTTVELEAQASFIAYDTADNLFSITSDDALSEIASGQQSASPVTIQGDTFSDPGGMQFAGKILNILAFGTYDYRFKISGATAKLINKVELNAESCDGISIHKNRLLCPDSGRGWYSIFTYPKGKLLSQPAIPVGPSVISAL